MRVRGVVGIVTSFVLLVVGWALVAPPASAHGWAPYLRVWPSTHLERGDVVTLRIRHLPAGAVVELFQCDEVEAGTAPPCGPALATVTASARGSVRTAVTLQDPLFHSREFGDPTVVYCRSDGCRLFAAWTGADGLPRVLASARLGFTGAPSTVTVSDADDLVDGQQVHVRGTAYGAAGRRVLYTQEACFSIVQGSGCYGRVELGQGVVRRDGTFRRLVTVHRFLADGTDCADAANLLGACEISVTVLRPDGQPDDTFGVASRGQPAAFLTFAAP